MPTEDSDKVEQKIRDLGAGWIALQGFNALTTFVYSGENAGTFNPSVGYPVKVFVHRPDGEMKLFPASLFLKTPPK